MLLESRIVLFSLIVAEKEIIHWRPHHFDLVLSQIKGWFSCVYSASLKAQLREGQQHKIDIPVDPFIHSFSSRILYVQTPCLA